MYENFHPDDLRGLAVDIFYAPQKNTWRHYSSAVRAIAETGDCHLNFTPEDLAETVLENFETCFLPLILTPETDRMRRMHAIYNGSTTLSTALRAAPLYLGLSDAEQLKSTFKSYSASPLHRSPFVRVYTLSMEIGSLGARNGHDEEFKAECVGAYKRLTHGLTGAIKTLQDVPRDDYVAKLG